MPVFAYAATGPGEVTSPKWCNAFAKGANCEVIWDRTIQKGDIALFGARSIFSIARYARRTGRNIYYGDHAYFRRHTFYRCTKNAFQHSGKGRGDETRFKALNVEIEPWRKDGRHVLVCPPDRSYCERNRIDHDAWQAVVLAELRANTDREIKIRERHAADDGSETLRAALKNCWALVTHHSNAAVEALCAGVPVFTTGDCAARSMGRDDLAKIEKPKYPDDRLRWASVLAANQWTFAEMRDGECWRAMQRQ